MKKSFIALLLLLIFTGATATTSVSAQDEELGKNEFTVWGGFSPDSATIIKATGRTEDARFGIAAFRYSRRFNNSDAVNLKYTADFVPVAVLNYPDVEVIPTGTNSFRVENVRPTRYGYGVAPLGLQANFRPRKKLQPFVELTGGLLYFNKRTPNVIGARFAFTASVGGGIEYRLQNKRSITFGYKFYHISNGDRGIENPGFDNNLFYVGYTFFSK